MIIKLPHYHNKMSCNLWKFQVLPRVLKDSSKCASLSIGWLWNLIPFESGKSLCNIRLLRLGSVFDKYCTSINLWFRNPCMEGCSLKSFEIQFSEKYLILEVASVKLQQKKHQNMQNLDLKNTANSTLSACTANIIE